MPEVDSASSACQSVCIFTFVDQWVFVKINFRIFTRPYCCNISKLLEFVVEARGPVNLDILQLIYLRKYVIVLIIA